MLKLSTLRETASGSPIPSDHYVNVNGYAQHHAYSHNNNNGNNSHRRHRSSTSSTSSKHHKFDVTDLVLIGRKVKFIAKEMSHIISRLGLPHDINASVSHMCAVLDVSVRKLNDSDRGELSFDTIRVQLKESLVTTLVDLRNMLSQVTLSSLLSSGLGAEAIRLSYFTLMSLFVELINVCKVIEPSYNPTPSPKSSQTSTPTYMGNTSSGSSSGLKFTSTRSHTQIQLSQPPSSISSKSRAPPPPLLTRAAAPSPKQMSIPIPMRQSSLSASVLQQQRSMKLETNNLTLNVVPTGVMRQDSEMSLNSAVPPPDLNDESKFFDLIDYTSQAAQVVFSQLNVAISRSAIATATSGSGSAGSNSSSSSELNDDNSLTHFASKIKELTTHCVGAMEQTKRVKASLNAVRISSSVDDDQQRRLYEETSLFLKSIIML
ncbi:unnamed protein product [Ambrosiozyma monospora]|uniref:Unnamed protein product n=1 Tax=Ambrosiozyma monospora TaxID=43982 RepID=A0ACB5T6N7_AMBMO|nr:unnamed protein product [Ambrosiozyma monospora]